MPRRPGAPAHAPDRKSRACVEEMSAAGVPQTAIARALDVDLKTLRKHYRSELDNATSRLMRKMSARLVTRAMGDDGPAVTALIFWLKARGGWNDRPAAPAAGQPAGLPADAVDVWGGEPGSPGAPVEAGE